MDEIKKRDFNKKVWIPLCANYTKTTGKYGFDGFIQEYFGVVSIIFPKSKQKEALALQWTDLHGHNNSKPVVYSRKYIEAGNFKHFRTSLTGKYIILEQNIDIERKHIWYPHQDLVLALGLIQQNNSYLCPEEDYLEIIRTTKNENGNPELMEIRTEHLKDFLSAKKSGLLLSTYQSRILFSKKIIVKEWKIRDATEDIANGHWHGYIREMHEGGDIWGTKAAVFYQARNDVDFDEDVPEIIGPPTDENTNSDSWEVESKGSLIYNQCGEIWKNEWIEPAKVSPRVRGDKISSSVNFIIDVDGRTLNADNLKDESRWLWFKPNLVNELLKKPTPYLNWYTEDTGKLGGAENKALHFGMNSLGFINVFAEDIYYLPEFHKKIWSAHNVTPDGKVSKELLMSQVDAKPAESFAPEKKLFDITIVLDILFQNKFGYRLFREHSYENQINLKIHRFIAINEDGLYKLANEISKFTVERIDVDSLKKILPLEDKKLGSIKRLEAILNKLNLDGREMLSVIVGIYELRNADAHLRSEDLSDSLKLTKIDINKPHVIIGKELIDNAAECFYYIAKSIKELKHEFIKEKLPNSIPRNINK